MNHVPSYRPSRRSVLQAAGLAGLGGLLAACGSGGSEGASPSGGGSAAADGAFPVTVEHRFGTTTITAPPQRVVAIGYTDADYLLAVGVVPVGVTQWIPQWKRGLGSWAVPKLGSTTPALFTPPWDVEKIAALGPDLIVNVTSDGSEEDYEKFSGITDTVALPAGFGAYGIPWQDATAVLTKAVGKQAEGETLVTSLEKQITDLAAANPDFAGRTVTIVTHYNAGGTIGVYHTSDTRMRLLAGLGFTATDYVKSLGEKDFFSDVSAENVDLLDADVVIAFGDPGESLATLYKNIPGLEALQATKSGALVPMNDLEPTMAFSASSVLSIPAALDFIVPPLQTAVAKAGAGS